MLRPLTNGIPEGSPNKEFPHYRLPIIDYRLPITNYQLPITDYRLPITDSPIPSQESPPRGKGAKNKYKYLRKTKKLLKSV